MDRHELDAADKEVGEGYIALGRQPSVILRKWKLQRNHGQTGGDTTKKTLVFRRQARKWADRMSVLRRSYRKRCRNPGYFCV